jgi:hypothetical protein
MLNWKDEEDKNENHNSIFYHLIQSVDNENKTI